MAEPPSALTAEERKAVSAALDEQASYLQMGIRAWENQAMPPDAPVAKADLEQQLAVVESARVKVLGHAAALRVAHRAGQERMRERAGAEADRTLLTPDPTVWKERPSALLGSRIRALPLEEPE